MKENNKQIINLTHEFIDFIETDYFQSTLFDLLDQSYSQDINAVLHTFLSSEFNKPENGGLLNVAKIVTFVSQVSNTQVIDFKFHLLDQPPANRNINNNIDEIGGGSHYNLTEIRGQIENIAKVLYLESDEFNETPLWNMISEQ